MNNVAVTAYADAAHRSRPWIPKPEERRRWGGILRPFFALRRWWAWAEHFGVVDPFVEHPRVMVRSRELHEYQRLADATFTMLLTSRAVGPGIRKKLERRRLELAALEARL